MPLTGRFNFRRTLTGRIVLQVEEDKPLWWSSKGKTRRHYRDANVMDLANPEMRALIDLRNKPQYVHAAVACPGANAPNRGRPGGRDRHRTDSAGGWRV